MKQTMINYIKRIEYYDEFYTPDEAIYPLIKHISPDWTVWECTDFGGSNIAKILKENGNEVISTHIKEDKNFFDYEPEQKYDCIITNPPYSLKNEFLQRAYYLDKPFAFLLPITTLEGQKRNRMFSKHGVEVLVLDKRINFMGGKKNIWFNTSWFCYNILPEKLMFAEVNR